MKIKNSLCIIILAAAAGCATPSTVAVKDPVGPNLAPPRPHPNQNAGQGQLVVYTSMEVANPDNSDFPTHVGYSIYGDDGKLLERVDNRSGSFYQSPASVNLSPGKYTIKAHVTNYGMVSVPVVIEENQTTSLDLDSSHFRQKTPTGAGQWVRLPGGEVIGMRAP